MSETLTEEQVQQIAIDTIHVGVRRRQKLGSIAALVKSIEAHGLIHPLVVRNGNELVVGYRRLEACRKLGWATVPVRRMERMSDDELRALELDENIHRADFTPHELRQARLAEIQAEQAALEEKARRVAKQTHALAMAECNAEGNTDKSIYQKRGQPKKAASTRAVAGELGKTQARISQIQTAAALAKMYPILQGPDWKEADVRKAGGFLKKVPEKERPAIIAMLQTEYGPLDKKSALGVLKSMAESEPERRKALIRDAQSGDERRRLTAVTTALQLPPPFEKCHQFLIVELEKLKNMRKWCQHPQHYEWIADAVAILEQALARHEEAYEQEKRRVLG